MMVIILESEDVFVHNECFYSWSHCYFGDAQQGYQ